MILSSRLSTPGTSSGSSFSYGSVSEGSGEVLQKKTFQVNVKTQKIVQACNVTWTEDLRKRLACQSFDGLTESSQIRMTGRPALQRAKNSILNLLER